jgi:hypothetical protein
MLRTWSGGRLYVLLDGLDHLADADFGKTLDWLQVDGLSALVLGSVACCDC